MRFGWKQLAIGLVLAASASPAFAQGWSNLPPGSVTVHATLCYAAGDANNAVGCVYSQEGYYACFENPSPAASATAGAACANNHVITIWTNGASVPIAIMSSPRQ